MRWNAVVNALALAGLAGGGWPVLGEPLPLLLAETEQGQADVRLYLGSEKLDGVRAFWDGQRLLTRSGHAIAAPEWFVAGFPRQALDGELWIGRGEFERLSGVVRRQTADDAAWRDVRYLVFELPQAPGTFRQRARALHELVSSAGVLREGCPVKYAWIDAHRREFALSELCEALKSRPFQPSSRAPMAAHAWCANGKGVASVRARSG